MIVLPSVAVTCTLIGLAPTLRNKAPLGVPEITALQAPPLIRTRMVAPASADVGVTVRLVMALATDWV